MSEVSAYLDFHPFRDWTVDRWDEETAIVDTKFHEENVHFTPLAGNTMVMPVGVDWEGYWRVNNEIIPAHTNHNTIGTYQRMMGPLYVDTRYRRVQSRYRWAAKTQLDQTDTLVSRFSGDTPTFIREVLRSQLANNIVAQTERISRDGFINHAQHMYLYDGSPFALGSVDFSDIPRDASGLWDVKLMEQVALRMAYRVEFTRRQWGNYAQPVPGSDFRGSALIMMSTGSFWGIWNSEEQDYMVDLRQLGDERIINGGQVQYRKFSTIVDAGPSLVLWNAGTIDKQCAVSSPVRFGDGSLDPDSGPVDSVFYMGQTSANITHYLQLTDFDTGDFEKGDFVTLHKARTDDWGITDGVNFLDGETMRAEVYSADATLNRLVLREPITQEFIDAFDYDSLAGTSNDPAVAYAYVTKAMHIHPVFVFAAREGVQWVRRRQPDGSLIQFHRPLDTNVDFPSIERVTANWRGEVNTWSPDEWEIFWCAAPFANRGGAAEVAY
ncbi:MAG: hypothetical protein ACYSYL_00155 [Planctomycetota bacterium]|jgi:hypothetical protein